MLKFVLVWVKVRPLEFENPLQLVAELAQARKAKMVIAPIPGERVQQSVNEFFSLDPALAKKLKAILIPG